MDWQQEFIATNLLAIGYNAWSGYLSGERGALICSTNSPAVSFVALILQQLALRENPSKLTSFGDRV